MTTFLTTAVVATAMTFVAAPQAGQVAQMPSRPGSDTSPRLHIGIVTTRPDDSANASAFAGGEDQFNRFVSVQRCGLTASSSEPEATPRVGWHVTARVLQRNDDGVAAEIQWQRQWTDGRRVTDGQKGSMQVTMRAGERLTLDRSTLEPNESCEASEVRLEATVTRGSFGATWATAGAGFGGRGGGRGGRGVAVMGAGASATAGAGASAGGVGAGASAGGSATATSQTGVGRGGRGAGGGGRGTAQGTTSARPTTGAGMGGGGRGGTGIGLTPRVTAPFDIEIWLVHKPTGAAERVQRVAMQGVPGGAAFEFPGVSVGTTTAEIAGRLTVADLPAGGRELRLVFDRRLVYGNGGSARSTGSRNLAMPGPEEVVEFELPEGTPAQAAAMEGHALSLRVRIKPSKESPLSPLSR
jgi:hypothetical protein